MRVRLGEASDVQIQGKGLLSTEVVSSLPLATRSTDPTLALDAHFFEFRLRSDDSSDGRMVRAHELQAGQEYEVVLTTGGGLYRYASRDVVRAGRGLTIRFLGRAGRSSDLVGKKLDQTQVNVALAGEQAARSLSAWKHAGLRCG